MTDTAKRAHPNQAASRVDPIRDAEALRALALLGDPPADWVLPKPGLDHDVVIVGAGQNGVALTYALRRLGMHKVALVDAAAEEGAGVWRAPARMRVLRTPKLQVGPELGISELSFRHWFEARHGAAAYDAIGFIARADWADYLDWFRDITAVRPRYGTRLALIEPRDGHIALHLERDGEISVETTRKVILATGIVGFGGPHIPPVVARSLPRSAYSHTADPIDFSALSGRTVAIVGGAASAFDAAGTALEAGAAEVHLFSRRDVVANHAPGRSRGYPGFAGNFWHLPDADRWWFALVQKRAGSTAPADAIERALAQPGFALHLGARLDKLRVEDGRVHFTDNGISFSVDHLILGTGYNADAAWQPELRLIAPQIATWGDRYAPPAELADADLAASPYLGANFQLLEREPGTAPHLADIHVLNAAAALSFGKPIGDVPTMAQSLPNLIGTVVRDLFLADRDTYLERARQVPQPSGIDSALYAAALWRPGRAAAE